MSVPMAGVFNARDTHARALRPGNRLIAHSEAIGWRSLYAAFLVEAPLDTTEPALGHPSLIYHFGRPTDVTRTIEGMAPERTLIVPRCFCITPGNATVSWRHSGQPEILQVYLRQSVLDEVTAEMYGGDRRQLEIVPRFAIRDPLLEQLAIAIIEALQEGAPGGGIYIDTLAQMMAAQFARAHASLSRPPRPPAPGGMTGWRVRRLADFIEANLAGDLSLEALAGQVHLSPLYLTRTFKAAFGEPPHQYVLRRRIERAKELLRDTEMPVVEVALAAGFSSQSHLSHWFQRMVGVAPGAYRRQV